MTRDYSKDDNREFYRKYEHAEVDYSRGKPEEHCSICKHYDPDGPHCSRVLDPIAPDMWCEEFTPR